MCKLLLLLNNTFIGTFTAGTFLAFLSFHLYKKQKRVDNANLDFLKVKSLASELFTEIDIASKKYNAQLNIYDESFKHYNLVGLIKQRLDQLAPNNFQEQSSKDFSRLVSSIDTKLEELSAFLKLRQESYSDSISYLNEKVPAITFMLNATNVLSYNNQEDLKVLREMFNEYISDINASLEKIIKNN